MITCEGFLRGCRAVPRIFLSVGANSAHLHRGLPYTDRASSWTFCFYPYTEGSPKTFKETNTLMLFVLNCHDLLWHKRLV